MKVGVYKIYQKGKPTKFEFVGTANIDVYMKKLHDNSMTYELFWECRKNDLQKFTDHFKATFKVKEPVEKKGEKEIETAVIPEPEMEKAIIKEPVKVKKVVRKKK